METENNVLQIGDVVTLSADAVYFDGKRIPDWVKKDQWIIQSIKADRVVINKNVRGTNEICSPVHIKYLQKQSGKEAALGQNDTGSSLAASACTPKSAPTPQPAPVSKTASASDKMHISDNGVELIAKFEGCRLEAYKCPAGVWTIGYGHTAGVKQEDKLPSVEAAKQLLKEDIGKYAEHVNRCICSGEISFPVNQNQFDALTSFCYNCGAGNLKRLVSGRNAQAVAEAMLKYNKGGGKVLAGLQRRREEEQQLFLS